MKFTIDHFNINVLDIEKSLRFYEEALGLREERRNTADDGSHIIVFVGDGTTANKLELTWLQSQVKPYDLGDEEFHIAFKTSEFDAAYAHHKKMPRNAGSLHQWMHNRPEIRHHLQRLWA